MGRGPFQAVKGLATLAAALTAISVFFAGTDVISAQWWTEQASRPNWPLIANAVATVAMLVVYTAGSAAVVFIAGAERGARAAVPAGIVFGALLWLAARTHRLVKPLDGHGLLGTHAPLVIAAAAGVVLGLAAMYGVGRRQRTWY